LKSSTVFKLVIALAVALVLIVPATFAQAVTGTITGVIKDPNGAVIPGANVIARNAGTNATAAAITDAAGGYKIINLVSGEYIVEVEAKGFRKTTTVPQRLSTGDVMRQDLTLELGQVTETVTVEETATRVNTEDAQLGKVVQDVYQLPIVSGAGGRNPLSLAVNQPGVVAAGQVGPFSVNGQRAQANNYMLDGGDSNDLAINVPDAVQQISPNALAEFRVVTGAMKAEYGRNSGAIVMLTTRSGSNQFHGGMSETFRNTKLNATAYFQNAVAGGTATTLPGSGFKRKPQWNTNDFDLQLGGPIKKDKVFFFANYLGFRRRQGVTNSATVFSDAERALITQYGTPEAKNLMALVPNANYGANTLMAAPANQMRRDQGLGKLDYFITDANRMSVSYFREPQDAIDPFAFGGSVVPGFGMRGTTMYENLVIRDTHTFSANLFNEFRGSFHRRVSDSVYPLNTKTPQSLGLTGVIPDDAAAAGPPFVDIDGLSGFGNTYQGPQARHDNTFQYIDNVSWTRGKHYMKFGAEFRTYAQNQVFDFINNGYIWSEGSLINEGFGNVIPGLSDPLTDFANGWAFDFEQSNSGRQGYRTRSFNWFWQDDFKVAPTFTLNFGVRYEYNNGLKELNNQAVTIRKGQQSTLWPTAPVGLVYPGDAGIPRSTYNEDLNNFAPRMGFAWDMLGNGKLSMRGGWGIYYDNPVSELTLQFLGVPPYGLQTQILYNQYKNPYETSLVNPIAQPFPFVPAKAGSKYDFTALAPLGVTVMSPNFRTPYGQQANLQLQHQLGHDWLLETGYVTSTGTKLLRRIQLNPAIPGPGATTGNTNSRRVLNQNNPQNAEYGGSVFGGITDQRTDANSNYHSLQASLTKRMSNGFTMMHSYTWGHSIDNSSGLRTQAGSARWDDNRYDRGNSEHDVRHRYVASYMYEFPVMKDQRGVVGKILGGWGMSGITTFQTGVPFNIYESTDRSLSGSGGDRPDYVSGTLTFYDPRGVSNVAGKLNAYFDGTGGGTATAATSPFFRRVGSGTTYAAGAGRYGSLGRNVWHGPGLNNWDWMLFKNFKITETHSLAFRTEMFNMWNHTQFNAPIGSIASTAFGRITSARDPRIIQFSLRYMF
jgi:hypothetical protein